MAAEAFAFSANDRNGEEQPVGKKLPIQQQAQELSMLLETENNVFLEISQDEIMS